MLMTILNIKLEGKKDIDSYVNTTESLLLCFILSATEISHCKVSKGNTLNHLM